MRTRCAEKLILSISKDASALFLLTNKRRIVEASTGIDKPWTSVRVSPMPPSRPELPWPPVDDRSERKHRRPRMPLSDAAAREIANVLRKYLETKAVEQIVNELLEIRGDKDFRDTIERLVDALRMTDR